jgi:NTP pyrophosphatase (non-canonical NTP hydrolase)
MTFDEYQEACGLTAIYPDASTGSTGALAYVALGLGETGELQGKVKKIIRDGVRDDAAMAAELGDILWYIGRFASELGLSLDQIAQGNLAKLNSRAERGVLAGSGDDR